MKSYVGCWWIHSTEFSKVKDHLQPVWFRFIQGFCVISLLMDLVALVLILVFFPKWQRLRFLKYRIRIFFIGSLFMLGSAFLVFLIALVFAEMSNDSDWMPRPWMNYLSWSYGLCVVSGFFGVFGGMSLFVLTLLYKDKELNGDPELTSAAEAVAKQRKLEKQDEMMRQQGGVMMEPIGPRTPYGSSQVGPRTPYGSGQVGPRTPYGSGQVHRTGHYQHQPAYPDRPDHRKFGHPDPPPSYGSQQGLHHPPHAPQSTAGSQASRAGSQSTRPAESFV